MRERQLSPIDKLLSDLQQGLRTVAPAREPGPGADYPAAGEDRLAEEERRHAAGLMRVNHAGEVAAQALYQGQSRTARDPAVREQLRQAAREEVAHLQWCEQRLRELGSAPSRLDPLWHAGSYAIGALAGLAGDRWSLGFVAETERQVAEHLEGHMRKLPDGDSRSRAIVERMHADETRHGAEATAAGGAALPGPVRGLMRAVAKLMTTSAYRV